MPPQNRAGVERYNRPDRDHALLIILLAVVAIAGTGVLGCGGLFVWRFLQPVSRPAAELPTPEEKRAELQAAFSAGEVGVPPHELRELERLFDRFTEIGSEQDDARFQELIHLERLHEEMHRSGQMPEQPRLYDILLRNSLADQFWLPVYATRYRILHVDSANSGEAVVYVHFWDALDEVTEMRVWTTRDRGEWEIFDWEMLQCGMRASFEMALYQSPGFESYFEFFDRVRRAERFFGQGEYDAGVERLRRCEALLPDIPDPLREQARIHLIYYWMAYGYHAEADELARAAVAPMENPGAIYAQMVYHNLQGEHDQVLPLCDRYEEAIGPGPNVAWYRAASLAGLQRHAEANAAREQYLTWDPANVDVLAEFALALDDDEKARFTGFLTQASEPLAVGRMLAERFSGYGDQAGLASILAFLADRTPAAADVEYVNGLRLELQGADVQAADRFLDALRQQTDEEARSESFWSYMACMNRLGQVLQAYERAPDPDEAFAWLANTDVEEGGESLLPPALLRELVERHRRRSPDDPWWAWHLGNLSGRSGDFDEALRYYEIGLGKLQDDDDEDADIEWAFDSQIRSCLVDAGRWQEAYERGDVPAESFETLAADFLWREQFDILRELVALHRARHSEDPMGCYYAARLALRDRQFDEADELLDDAWSRLEEDDYRRYPVRTARVDLHVAAGHALDAYGDVSSDEETFSQLALHFRAERDFHSLDELIRLRRRDAPDDAEPLYWQANSRFLQRDYAGVLDTVAGADAELLESLEEYRRKEWDMLHLRSLLRTEQFPDALELAREISARQAGTRALMIALICSGRHEEARELLPDNVDVPWDSIYNDPDAGPILRSDAFRDVRVAAPPRVPWLSTTPLVALLDQPLQISRTELQAVATRLFGPDAGVVPLQKSSEEQVETFVVSTDSPQALVVCGRGRYQEDLSELRPGLFADVERWEAVNAHQAWCAFVRLHDSHDGDDGRHRNNQLRFAGAFFGEHWRALWDGATGRILVPTDGLPELLLDAESAEQLETAGEPLWLYRDWSDGERDGILEERIQRLFHAAVREWSASDAGASLEVVTRIEAAPTSEPLRIQVESVRRAPWSGWTLTGRLINDSQLVPWMQAGEPIRVESSSVVDWTLTNETVTSHARTEAEQWWQRTRSEATDPQPDE